MLRLVRLVHAGQGTGGQRSERPVGRRRCRVGALVVQHVQERARHLCVRCVLGGDEQRPVGTGLVEPDLQAVLRVRLLEELTQPGVGLRDREVSNLGGVERLRVGIAEGRIGADLAGQLGEAAVVARSGERRRNAVHPEPTALADGLARVVGEGVRGALDLLGQEVILRHRQVLGVAGLGCDGRPEDVREDDVAGHRCEQRCRCHGGCRENLRAGGSLQAFHRCENRGEDDEQEHPVAGAERQHRQRPRAHDERDAREGAAGTDGPDEGGHGGEEPQGRPAEEVIRGPHDGEGDGAERADTGQVALLLAEGDGRQDHAQDDEC